MISKAVCFFFIFIKYRSNQITTLDMWLRSSFRIEFLGRYNLHTVCKVFSILKQFPKFPDGLQNFKKNENFVAK